ncbi:MAG: hypothetical protein HN687_08910, partial [Candidatus Marinimicrobia bacterium]|nr:hypothetical protein [Candidatus Neomarinimicrobiota bacterium]
GEIGGWTINSATGIYKEHGGAYTGLNAATLSGKYLFSGATSNTGTGATNYLRADGVGYFANGALSWTSAGVLTVNRITATAGTLGTFMLDDENIFGDTSPTPETSNLQIHTDKKGPYIALRSYSGYMGGRLVLGNESTTDTTSTPHVFGGERLELDADSSTMSYYTSSFKSSTVKKIVQVGGGIPQPSGLKYGAGGVNINSGSISLNDFHSPPGGVSWGVGTFARTNIFPGYIYMTDFSEANQGSYYSIRITNKADNSIAKTGLGLEIENFATASTSGTTTVGIQSSVTAGDGKTYGIKIYADSAPTNYGVYSSVGTTSPFSTNYAGYFADGDVVVENNLTSSYMKVDNNLSVEGDVEFAKSGTAYPTLRLVSTSHAATPAVKFYTNTSDNDGEKLHFQLARANTSGLATIGYNSIGTFSTTMYGAVHMQPDFGSNCALNVNGNIGIGTASPSAPLNVETTTAGTQTMISISSDEGMTAVPGTNNLFGIAFEDVGGANHVGHIGLAFDGTTTNMHFGGLYHSGYNAWTDQLMTIKGNGNVGIGTTNPGDLSVAGAIASTLEIAGNYGRTAHHIGGFVGGYNNIANNSTKSNPIYVIGSNYQPTDAALSNMYGIGYTHTNASFIDNTDGGWGMYVAAAGDARIWLAASDGTDSYFNAGNIAIGTTGSLSLLHIQQSTDNDDGGIRLYNVQDGTYWSQVVNTSEYLYFNYNGGSYGGYIKNNVNVGQIDFTGQHRNSISTGTVNEHTGSIGYIVCADGTYDNLWDNNDNV